MRIWWYIAFQFLKNIIAILILVLLIYFILTYMEESQRYFDKYDVPHNVIFRYYFWQLPAITIQLLPFVVLVAGIITNWVLAKHGEIAALRAAGLSIMRVSFPLISIALAFMVAHFMISEFILPASSNRFYRVQYEEIEKNNAVALFTDSTWLKAINTILHFDEYDEIKQELFNVEYFKTNSEGSIVQIVHAKSGYFEENISRWVLRDTLTFNFDFQTESSLKAEIKPLYVTNVDFAPPKVLMRSSESSQISFWQLKKLIDKAEIAGANVSDRMVDLYFKLSTPFANLLFVFLTIPFALKKERNEEKYIGIVICIAASLLYWFGNISLRSFAIKGSINPIFAAWAMNFIVALLSYGLIRKLDKGQ
ncbi:LptF/LptG family permease [Spirobacillus cienkowskii]|jgi:lipopolysaccharide export system permease protein|uniref:YjgP/YjgQ family permease n=1 Tax=Spirobacillus cienkowskii TaxID=495820 RepID=A0A369KSQ2_9BACT|nr:MAG: YjgP/YjgQ family permease [Spirobacillus cienkowskii]